jgi:hypothetical protein
MENPQSSVERWLDSFHHIFVDRLRSESAWSVDAGLLERHRTDRSYRLPCQAKAAKVMGCVDEEMMKERGATQSETTSLRSYFKAYLHMKQCEGSTSNVLWGHWVRLPCDLYLSHQFRDFEMLMPFYKLRRFWCNISSMKNKETMKLKRFAGVFIWSLWGGGGGTRVKNPYT